MNGPCLPDISHPIYGNAHFCQQPFQYSNHTISSPQQQIIQAITSGQVDVLSELLKEFSPNTPTSDDGETPLSLATSQGQLSCVELLLRMGADPKKSDRFLWTPLHAAAAHNRLNIATLLLNFGVSINALSYNGQSALSKS
jgi:ankyrin repeat protein